MSYVSGCHQSNATKRSATFFLQKYSSELKWKKYKENVLDVGCADGSLTMHVLYPQIKDHIENILAVDILDEMIDFAGKSNKIAEIDYRCLDIMDSQAASEYQDRFDHIFSFMVLHFVADNRSRRFFTALYNMLKPDGQIFVTAAPNNVMVRTFRKQLAEEKWRKYAPKEPVFADYADDPEKIVKQIVKDVGFRIDVCEQETKIYNIQNFKDLATTGAHVYFRVSGISEEVEEDFVRELVPNFIEEFVYIGEPDEYAVTIQQLICIASKIV